MTKRRNIMKEFEIKEISAVDKPAQIGARATIMKRHTEEEAPATSTDHDAGTDTEAETIGKKEDQMSDQTKTADDAVAKQELEALTKRAERAEAVLSLGSEERSLFDGFSADEQDAFLSKSADERSTLVKNAQNADPIVYTTDEGEELSKSAGDTVIRMAKKLDEQARQIAKAESLAKRADVEKRASEELSNLGGELVAKADLLEAIETLPEEKRGPVLEIVKAQDAGLGKAFERVGTTSAPKLQGDSPMAKLDQLAKAKAEADGTDHTTAYNAILSTPEGESLYNESAERQGA
tara:strand:- start:829 stop:1710 length:882 start_codon:yes stop_codon:yes gene_type:complete